MTIKDTNYWKEYNQKRREYLTQKKQEARARLKMSTTDNLKVVDSSLVVDKNFLPVVDIQENISVVDKVVDTQKKVVDQNKNMSTTQNQNPVYNQPKKLWKDFYTELKPHCWNCLKKGIGVEEYAFCSAEKKPEIIRDEQGKVIHTFNNIYACQVYHWTIYQRQGKIING